MDFHIEDLNQTKLWVGIINRLREKGIFDEEDVRRILCGAASRPPAEREARGPKLRQGLAIGRTPEGDVLVEDPVAWKAYRLDRRTIDLILTLDGEKTYDQLLATLARAGEVASIDDLQSFLLRLETLDLLDTREAQAHVRDVLRREEEFQLASSICRIVDVKEPDRETFVFMDGARYQCFACGTSCTYPFPLGPIPEDERRRIEAFDWSKILPGVDRFFYDGARVESQTGAMETKSYLAKKDGACVFLDPKDRLCLVHKEMGVEAKPLCCRKWPFEFFAVGDEIHVSMRYRCFDKMHVERSRIVAADAPQIHALLKAGPIDAAPDVIPLTPAARLRLADYLVLEERLLDLIEHHPGGSGDRLEAAGALIDAVVAALPETPAGAEPPDARAAVLAAEPRATPVAPQVDPRFAAFLLGLYQHFYRSHIVTKGEDGSLRDLLVFLRSAILSEARPEGADLLSLAIEPGDPVDIAPVTLDEAHPRVLAQLTYYARNHIFGKRPFAFPTYRKGYLGLCLHHYVVTRLARYHAARDGRREATPEDLARALEAMEHIRERSVWALYLQFHPRLADAAATPGAARVFLGRGPAEAGVRGAAAETRA